MVGSASLVARRKRKRTLPDCELFMTDLSSYWAAYAPALFEFPGRFVLLNAFHFYQTASWWKVTRDIRATLRRGGMAKIDFAYGFANRKNSLSTVLGRMMLVAFLVSGISIQDGLPKEVVRCKTKPGA